VEETIVGPGAGLDPHPNRSKTKLVMLRNQYSRRFAAMQHAHPSQAETNRAVLADLIRGKLL
jgi:hypothetical protein